MGVPLYTRFRENRSQKQVKSGLPETKRRGMGFVQSAFFCRIIAAGGVFNQKWRREFMESFCLTLFFCKGSGHMAAEQVKTICGWIYAGD
jgi:hypothetical protein